MARYEAIPMTHIEHMPDDRKNWMVVECDDKFARQFDHIVTWTYQGKPEDNERNARLVADALNAYQPELVASEGEAKP